MIVLDSGHVYELNTLDGETYSKLIFVKRVGDKYPWNNNAHPGTTSQEVLRALINRACYVNMQTPCWQTKLSIRLMHYVVWLYEHRAAKRHGRRSPSMIDVLYGIQCRKCGHVGCKGGCHG